MKRLEEVKAIVQRALALGEPERGKYLDDACGGDDELRRAVERALGASDLPSILETGAALDRWREFEEESGAPIAPGSATITAAPSSPSIPGYRIVRMLGEGAR
jgi:hypothetical protein